MQDSIIVYHNPLEKALWEGTVDFNVLTGFVLSLIVFFVILCVLNKVLDHFFGFRFNREIGWKISMASAFLGFGFTIYLTMIL